MPGPVSDSYDPEFGTVDNAAAVRELIEDGIALLATKLGQERVDILALALSENEGRSIRLQATERVLRGLRFAAFRALESI